MPHLGIAIATTLAGWVNALQLWHGLVKRGHFEADARLLRNLPLIGMASVVMGFGLWLALPFFVPYLDARQIVPVKFSAMALLILLGSVVFFGLIHVTGVLRLRQFIGRLKR